MTIQNDVHNITGTHTSNIHFRYAVNSWVRGIESIQGNFAHLELRTSSNIEISENYFHHAHNYGGGGNGYGIALQFTANECLIENNVFKHLRHAILLQAGANGNVISYNYSTDPYRDDFFSTYTGDIVLHGNYPYCNLIENNICQTIFIDKSHGLNGPYNTFYRNRIELHGLFITGTNSPYQNIIANEIVNVDKNAAQTHYINNGVELMAVNNNHNGELYPLSQNLELPPSLFYQTIPSFLNDTEFGGIGTPAQISQNSIPAKDRYTTETIVNFACDQITNQFCQDNPDTDILINFSHIDFLGKEHLFEGVNIQIREFTDDDSNHSLIRNFASDIDGTIIINELVQGTYELIVLDENFELGGALDGYTSSDLEIIDAATGALGMLIYYDPNEAIELKLNFTVKDVILSQSESILLTAKQQDRKMAIHLNWSVTDQEEPIRYFIIRNDEDGNSQNFHLNQLNQNHFTDTAIEPNQIYYYEVCGQGKENKKCSDIIAVQTNPTSSEILVYPNPVRDVMHFITELEAPYQIQIVDSQNRIIITEVIQNNLESYIDTSTLPVGIYHVQASNEIQIQTKKIVKL